MTIYAKTEKPVNGVSITFGIDLEKRELDIFYRVTLPSGREIEFHGSVCGNCYHINEFNHADALQPKFCSLFYYGPNGNWSLYRQYKNGKIETKSHVDMPYYDIMGLSQEDIMVAVSEQRNFLNLSLRYNNNGGI